MARVLDEPPQEKRTVCREGCGRAVAYVPNDVQEYNGTDISGGPDGRRWITCPGCGKQITLESW